MLQGGRKMGRILRFALLSTCAWTISGFSYNPLAVPTSKLSRVISSGKRIDFKSLTVNARRIGLRKSAVVTLMNQVNAGDDKQEVGLEGAGPLRKYGLLGFWLAFIAYGALIAPTGDAEIQQNMLKGLIAPPPWDSVNPIFAAVFMMLGIWPAVMGALLMPLKPKSQTLPAWPFITASFALGAFALTPYLALTSYQPGDTDTESLGAKIFGSPLTAAFLLVNTVLLLLFALGVFAPNDLNGGSDYPVDVIFYTYLRNYGDLFSTYKLVNLPSCDFIALWALSSVPLLEDMRRRGWYAGAALDKALYASFMLAPLIGACTWLAVRPPLPASAAGAGTSAAAEAPPPP